MRLPPPRQAGRSPASTVLPPGSCLPAQGLSPRLETSGRRPAPHFPPPHPLFLLTGDEQRSPRNPSRHSRAPTRRQKPSSPTTVSIRTSALVSVDSPSQLKPRAIDDDVRFTFLPPAAEEKSTEFVTVELPQASPFTPFDSW